MKSKFFKNTISSILAVSMVFSMTAAFAPAAFAADNTIRNDQAGIPDRGFYNCMLKYDANKDGMLSTTEASSVEQLVIYGDIGSLEGIRYFTGAKKLIVDKCGVKAIPEEISALKDLTVISISNNKLTTLPTAIGTLTKLESIVAASNRITSIPSSIGNLKNLTNLNLRDNRLTALPSTMKNLSRLELLNLSANRFKAMPSSIGYLKSLRTLLIAENQLTAVSTGVKNLKQCATLDISKNKIKTLPKEIGYMTALETLKANNNSITSAYSQIGNLKKIAHIDLSNNNMKTLPTAFGKLTSLQNLNLANNQITKIPSLKKLTKLNVTSTNVFPLNLRGNKLSRTNIKKYAPTKLVNNTTWYKYQTTSKFVPVASLTAKAASATVKVGQKLQLSSTVSPSNATYKTVDYKVTLNEANASVTSKGVFTAKRTGYAVVLVSAKDNSGIASAVMIMVE